MKDAPFSAMTDGGELTRWNAAQAAVIGSMLIDDRCCGAVFQATTAEMFSDSTMRHIYDAARKVWLERQQVDPVLVIAACGSDSYGETIAACMRDTPTAANVLSYCELLQQCLQLSLFRSAAFEILDAPTAEACHEIWQRLGRQLMGGKKKRIVSYSDMMSDFFDRMDDKTPPDFIDWGFPALNETLTVTNGRFVVIGAESSVGKTAFALQLARGMAKAGKKVGFFSLETSAPDAADRLVANAADVALPAIKHRRLDAAAIQRATREAEAMYGARFDLIEAAGYSTDDIQEDTIANRYEVIFIDYVQIVQTSDADDVARQVRSVSIALHNMAIRLHCTVIALSQVTPPEKGKNGKRRMLSKWDLRESKQLVQDGEAVVLLDLTDLEDYSSNRYLIIDKNKDGPCGRMLLAFDAQHMRFSYVPPYEGTDAAAARERNEKMDRNREARREKAARRKGLDGQVGFHDLEDDEGGDPPF